MYNKWLLLVVFLTNHGLNLGIDEVDAGAHELVPFRSSWFGSVEKNRQVEETPTYVANNEELAEFAEIRPRKLKNRETAKKRTEEPLKKSHDSAKKKKKKKRKRKKKPVPKPRRFVKTPNFNTNKDKESNMTDSIEVTKRAKPVDIIVHIKVSE